MGTFKFASVSTSGIRRNVIVRKYPPARKGTTSPRAVLAVAAGSLFFVTLFVLITMHILTSFLESLGYFPRTVERLPTTSFRLFLAKHAPAFRIYIYDPPERDVVSTEIARNGRWDLRGTALLAYSLEAQRDGSHHVVDVGGNLGWFSLAAAAQGAQVTTIEALPDNCRAIRLAVAANSGIFDKAQINLIEAVAVGNSSEPGSEHICLDQVERISENVGNGRVPQIPQSATRCSHWLKAVTLDDVVDHGKPIAFLKADCEGCEIGALAGAGKLLTGSTAPCVILVEWFPRLTRNTDWNSQRHIDVAIGHLNAGSYEVYSMSSLSGGAILSGPASGDHLHRFFSGRGQHAVVMLQTSSRCFPVNSEKRRAFIQNLRENPRAI